MEAYITEMGATQESKILNALVQQPDASAADAVQQILNLTLTAAASSDDPNSLGNHPWHTCTSLLEIVARTAPTRQAKLGAFISQLQKITVKDPTTGEPLRYHDLAVWTDLPSFGWNAADEWNFNHSDPNTTTKETWRWENKMAFLAQLTAAAEVNYATDWIGPIDFSLYALWAFCDAFEQEETPQAPANTTVRATCLWYVYTAERLWANVKNDRAFGERHAGTGDEGQEEEPRKGPLAHGGTKKLIKDAVAHINRVEAEN